MSNTRKTALTITMVLFAMVLLAFLLLAWYGAEMLLYGYSQPSIVKGIVAIAMVLMVTSRMKKEIDENERKRKLAREFLEARKAEEKED